MKLLFLVLLFLFTSQVFSQDNHTIYEKSEDKICGKIIRLDGVWVENGRLKADISILAKQYSKPMTGGYKMGDTIEIKSGCKYFVKLIQKFGINDGAKGYVELSNEVDLSDYLDVSMGNLRLNEKFYTGNTDWKVTSISKDEAEFTQQATKTTTEKTIIVKKGDIIWKGFAGYEITDFLANTSDKLSEQWTIELKQIKDFSYRTVVIPGDLYNAPKEMTGTVQYVIRKMKYYPKQKFNQAEYDAVPVKYWVLKVFNYPTGEAHMMIEVTVLGEKSFQEYEGYKSFDTEAEALEYAKANGITDIKLE